MKSLTTSDDPNSPDYIIFAEAEWDVAGFQNQRARALFAGFTTLGNSQVDIYSLPIDPNTGDVNKVPLASTVNNPKTINQGIPPGAGSSFKVRYDIDFILGAPVRPGRSACENLSNAGFVKNAGDSSYCTGGATMEEEFSVVAPVSRDLIGVTRRATPLAPGVFTTNIRNQRAQSGRYLNPVGIGHPDFVEIDLNAVATPFIFTGEPWLLDRRVGPGGCENVGGCPTTGPAPLQPFPYSGLDPRTQAGVPGVPVGARNRILSYWPFGSTNVLNAVPSSICDTTAPPAPVIPVCGNNVIDLAETCDDGNTTPGDGCDAACQIEACVTICGNGINDAGEQCDDGNLVSGDGCDAFCQLEAAPVCGNGLLEAGEACDDGNTAAGDGCDAACQIEPPAAVCGNGLLEAGETCDDGNVTDGDGCDASCQIEVATGTVTITRARYVASQERLRVRGFVTPIGSSAVVFAPGSPNGGTCTGTLLGSAPTDLDGRFLFNSGRGAFPVDPGEVCVSSDNGAAAAQPTSP